LLQRTNTGSIHRAFQFFKNTATNGGDWWHIIIPNDIIIIIIIIPLLLPLLPLPLLLQSALQPLVGFRPAQLSLSILSRKVLQSAVASGTTNPQLGGEPGI
jgi:hypothetical protein